MRLTFDDGPSACTEPILDLLGDRGATATFFVVGRAVRRRPATVLRAARDGHEVANHTDTHAELTGLSDEDVAAEIDRCADAVEAIGLPRPCRLRPPLLAFDRRIERIAARMGVELVRCTIDPRDWEEPGADEIAARFIRQLDAMGPSLTTAGTVMLHDGPRATQTVEALPRILDRLDEAAATGAG